MQHYLTVFRLLCTTCINARLYTPTKLNDTDISCHIKAVELVEHSIGNNCLPVKHSFTQVSSKDPKKFSTFLGLRICNKASCAPKQNWTLGSFPKEDFRGFLICYSTKIAH